MGKQVQVNSPYTRLWLYAGGVFDAGATAVLTDAEWAALGAVGQGRVTVLNGSVADPDRSGAVAAPESSITNLIADLASKASVASVALKSNAAETINAQTGTAYTLVLADADSFVTMTNASASTVTVPPNSSVAFPVGTKIRIAQRGVGQVTIVQGAGVTVENSPGLKIANQFGTAALVKVATDTWMAMGRLSA